MFKASPKSDKEFLSGAHCISYAFHSMISKLLEIYGPQLCAALSNQNLLENATISIAEQVTLQLQSIASDQIVISWHLPDYTLSDLCNPPDDNSDTLKTCLASDLSDPSQKVAPRHPSNRPFESIPRQKSISFKKHSSRVPADWDCLIFRGNSVSSSSILAVTASDIHLKVNGTLLNKSDYNISIKNRTVSFKLPSTEEIDVVLLVANLESDALKILAPKRPVVEKQRKGALLASKFQPVFRSIGVLAVESNSQSDINHQVGSPASDSSLDEPQIQISTNGLMMSELKKDLEELQTQYKISQSNLRRLRREYTRATCNLKSDIEAHENNMVKDLAMEHKTRHKFQTIQEAIGSTEHQINEAMQEIKSIQTMQATIKQTEIKTKFDEVNSLKDTLKLTEKANSKANSQIAKTITISSAEITALLKILEEGQKELKAAEIGIESLKVTELMAIESLVDQAWSKQSEMKESSDSRFRLITKVHEEKKASLEKIRQQCETIHSKMQSWNESFAKSEQVMTRSVKN
ncbi:hypothetical protein BCR33DRAFT_326667 [Rhizoclosmatium globosum]|uniref:Uncharacterized protein n=1 Tax=Rhizoclosmatium globosum TaxID=329046 RepID=A0A1Y2C4J6_9FUNG|nr:hypothetical protein BCR33DRAFT_326667 [Rhizoclosmatium globosum]|eukprot:ORY41876.1 hypothetical protein BCR33DRAFT_326667 [Rhizoclosmatium globosum]